MKRNKFVELIVEYGGAKLADQLPRSLRLMVFSAGMAAAALFALAWASVTGWMALHEEAQMPPYLASLTLTGFFALTALGIYLFRQYRVKKPIHEVAVRSATRPLENMTMKAESITQATAKEVGNGANAAVDAAVGSAAAVKDVFKRGAEGTVAWIKENPVQATLIGTATGLLLGMAVRRFLIDGEE